MSVSNKAVNMIDNLLDGFDSNDVQREEKELSGYDKAQQNVYVVSEELPKDTPIVKGPDFNESRCIDYILNAFRGTGFQASNLAFAIDRIKEMVCLDCIMIILALTYYYYYYRLIGE